MPRSSTRRRGTRSPSGCSAAAGSARCSIADLARLAAIATPQFAALIGEVAAQRALELVAGNGPLRGGHDLEAALRRCVRRAALAARAEALVSALAHAAGRRRKRYR